MQSKYRIFFLCFFGLTLSVGLCAAEVGPPAGPPPGGLIRQITPITDALYRYQYHHHVSLFLVTQEGIIVTDPPNKDAALWLKAELKKRFQMPVRYMIYSHDHPDHIGGAEVFADETVTIVAHELTKRVLAEQPIAGARLPLPDITFSDGMTLSLGGKTVELSRVDPSTHAEGLITMNFVEDRTLFAVDLVVIKGVTWMNFNDNRFPAIIDTIKSLEELDFDHFASGHYKVATKAEVTEHRQYLEDLRDAVLTAIKEGKTLKEAKQTIRLDQYKDFALYDEWLSFNVEGAYRHLKLPSTSISQHRIATSYEDPENTEEIAVYCAFCHGADGFSLNPQWPNLAGQKEEYLLKALKDFRAGDRYDNNMAPLGHYVTEEEFVGLASYYNRIQSKPFVEIVRKAAATQAEYHNHIAPEHAAETNVAAAPPPQVVNPNLGRPFPEIVAAGQAKAATCVACHGQNGIGIAPTFPNLAGQNIAYLIQQLQDFRDGSRKDPVMAPLAKSLSDVDIVDLAVFYSSLENSN